jgi:hypothetical protein
VNAAEVDIEVKYDAPPTVWSFMQCDDFVRFIVGPVGSSKSSGCIVEILKRAAQQEPGPDGVRRTRFAIIRNTYRELEDTTRKTFEQWVRLPPPLGRWHEQPFTFEIDIPETDGGPPIHSEILFRALDRPEDAKKLLSLELTGAYINEAREIPKHVFEVLQTRVGRFPSKDQGGATWFGIWGDSNPWHSGHWGAKLFAKHLTGYRLFRQPGGRSDRAENVENLPAGYYSRLVQGKDKEWVRVYVDGEDATADEGSVFGAWLGELQARGSICAFDHPKDNVYTHWDLGLGDATAVWFWRLNRHGVPDILDHYEASGQGLSHYFGVVESKPYAYAKHFLPHDAANKTLATQVTVLDQFVERFGAGKVASVPKVAIEDGIQAGRWLLEQPVRIHERVTLTPDNRNYSGLEALAGYRFAWDETLQCFDRNPVHDWASHTGDAFRYLALTVKRAEAVESARPKVVTKNPAAAPTLDEMLASFNKRPQGPKRI